MDNYTGGGRTEEAEDEKRTKVEGFSVCVSNSSKLSLRPRTDLHCYVAHLEQSVPPYAPSVATQVRDQLRRSMTKNFEGRDYIARRILCQVMSKDLIRHLIQDYTSKGTPSEAAKWTSIGKGQDVVGYIKTEARVLLALCIFINASMHNFLVLLEAGISDSSLPLTGDCPTGVDKADFVRLLDSQWIFLPYDLFVQPDQIASS